MSNEINFPSMVKFCTKITINTRIIWKKILGIYKIQTYSFHLTFS